MSKRPYKRLSMEVDAETHQYIRLMAVKHNMSIKQWVSQVLILEIRKEIGYDGDDSSNNGNSS